MAYFITGQDSTKGKDPNINIINGIHNIKGKTSFNIPVSNYINKHITFNKGEYIGQLEPAIEDIEDNNPPFHAHPDTHSMNNVTTQWKMVEQVEPDTCNPSHDTLKQSMDAKLQALLKEYTSQFAQGRMSVGTTPLTEMTIDTKTPEPVSQNLYPIAMKQ